MTRFPRSLMALHWLLALMIPANLAGGAFYVRRIANDDPTKLQALELHMSFGMAIAALMVLRLILRWRLPRPQTTGLALWAHRGIYTAALLLPVTGMWMTLSARLNDIVFARNGAPLPADLATVPGHLPHLLLALVLTGLIVVHLVDELTGY
jgi:cytochrome b561